MATQSFRELKVWQKAHELVLMIYNYSEHFPKTETYCLVTQLRRAAISIPANIAEGYKKKGKADKLRFYNIAQGSLQEVHYYLILSADLGYGATEKHLELLDHVERMLEAYCQGIAANM
jgi:four helix bundle protein